jgi:hypothetical protein
LPSARPRPRSIRCCVRRRCAAVSVRSESCSPARWATAHPGYGRCVNAAAPPWCRIRATPLLPKCRSPRSTAPIPDHVVALADLPVLLDGLAHQAAAEPVPAPHSTRYEVAIARNVSPFWNTLQLTNETRYVTSQFISLGTRTPAGHSGWWSESGARGQGLVTSAPGRLRDNARPALRPACESIAGLGQAGAANHRLLATSQEARLELNGGVGSLPPEPRWNAGRRSAPRWARAAPVWCGR